MEKDRKVTLVNMTNGQVSINLPELRINKNWSKKDSKNTMEFDQLEQAFYEPGVEYMLKQGMLWVDDKEVRIALGLESAEEGVEPDFVILDDKQRERYLKIMPFYDFKENVKKLGWEQLQALTDYAVEHEIIDMDKCALLKELTQVDIVRAIQLKRDAKEA